MPLGAPPIPTPRQSPRISRAGYSTGFVIIALLAIASSALVLLRKPSTSTPIELWTFARQHIDAYDPVGRQWNAANPEAHIGFRLFDGGSHERRILSAFRSGTPLGDILEVHEGIISNIFAGPVDSIGFVDLTDRLEREGLLDTINRPSFSVWSTRGRVFGLPHDVHPVLLAYRSDLAEAAGIDVSKIETWADFMREFAPLMAERDAQGRPTRYLLSLWPNQTDAIFALMLQAGGGPFNLDGSPSLDRPENVMVAAQIAVWCGGPARIALDSPEFTFTGNKTKADGLVVAAIMPDWLTSLWERDIPELRGKLKLMPIPAWKPGGLRTSVMGGTMAGIAKSSEDPERAWEAVKKLYLNAELWDGVYKATGIIPPLRSLWDRPVYATPNEYFSGQPAGLLYIQQAPHVPTRVSSPFRNLALQNFQRALYELIRIVNERGITDPKLIEDDARRLLAEQQAELQRRMARNVFYTR